MQILSPSKNSTTVRKPFKPSLRLAKVALQTAFGVSDVLGATLATKLFTSPRRHTRPARERAFLTTARARQLVVTLRSPRWRHSKRTIATWRWGFGPTVMLVHGWEGRGSQLGAFVEPLVAAGLSVVAFDAPGHGNSPEHQLYLTDLADCIADIAAATGPLHAIIAHSFGAAAVLLAHTRAGLEVPRTIFVSPNAIVDESIQQFARTLGLDDADRTLFEHRLVAQSGVPFTSLAVDRLTAGRDSALLIFHDDTDREVPLAQGERLAAAWQNAQLVITHDLGHRRILRDLEVIAAAVSFAREGVAASTSDLVREVDRDLQSGSR
jgi:pimeloyl-ACP methyl ester carboxylesterase